MKWMNVNVFFSISFFVSTIANAGMINVNCSTNPPGALSAAVSSALPGTVIQVSGTCNDAIVITQDDITLIGSNTTNSNLATISGFFPEDRVTIDGASRTVISGFNIEKGLFAIVADNNASATISNVFVRDNILGVDFINGALIKVEGTFEIRDSRAFGLQVLTGSKLVITENATLRIKENFLGSQISINSTLFATTGSSILVHDNSTIGLSVNTGSTGMLFNAKLHTHDNGLDGLDVVSHANFEIDGEAEVISENNGREGVSVDNSTLNMFGFFSTVAGFPKLISNGNTLNGVLVESTSKLDVGRNASIIAKNNGEAGIALDDGSSAILKRSEIVGNKGKLKNLSHFDEDDREKNGSPREADVVVSFASRITFDQEADNNGDVVENEVGLALCDRTSLSRGDVSCKR